MPKPWSIKRQQEAIARGEKPTPGKKYTVPRNSWLDGISFEAYGYDRTPDIISANPFLSKRRVEPNSQLPYIHPGDKIFLPAKKEIEDRKFEKIEASHKSEVSIRIDGKIFTSWTTNNIDRSINDVVDQFSFTAPYNPETASSKYLDPYTYFSAEIFIGGKLFISGRTDAWSFNIQQDKTEVTVQCRSKAADIVDCESDNQKLSYRGQNLQQIADDLLNPWGIKNIFPYGPGAQFRLVSRKPDEKIWEFISDLAARRGFVVNSDRDGALIYDRAAIDSDPILNIEQGKAPLTGISPTYNGSKRFSDYIALGQTRGKPGNKFVATDGSINIKRPHVFKAKNTDTANAQVAAETARARAFSSSAKISVTVDGWHDKNGDIFLENRIVSLVAPSAAIFNKTNFLIEKVSLSKDAGNQKASLELVLPQAYTLEMPEKLFYEREE